MNIRDIKSRLAILGWLVLLGTCTAAAQLDTGTLQGTVKDATGAVIPQASVVVTDNASQHQYHVASSSSGEYTVPSLPVGVYAIAVTAPGFSGARVIGVALNASELHRADVVLKAGAASAEVTVTANQEQVNTLSSDLGTTIGADRIANLPLNGRDFTDLLGLVPGSVTSGQFGQTSLGGAETSFAGLNILLDGSDATRIDTNATSMQLGREGARITRASVDSIAEFHILQGNFSAQYGRSIGDVVNVITKSGSNDWHGEAFEFIRNNAFDARNYFATPGSSTPLRLNQFGGNLSGPIKKDHLFFFTNYEGVRQTITNTAIYDVLNAAQRAKFVPALATVVAAIPIGNLGPEPTDPADFDRYSANLINTLREDTGSLRVDWIQSQKSKYYVRYNIGNSLTNTTYGPAVGQNAPTPATTQFLKISNTYIFSPSLLNEAGFGINSNKVESYGGGGPFPVVAFSCFYCNFGVAPGPATFASIRPQTSYQAIDTLTKVLGKETFTTGFDIRHNLSDEELGLQEFLSFGSISDFEANNGFAFSTLGNPMTRIRNTNYDFFLQDDIRLTRNFTLNAGVRYEYNTVLHERDGQLANFDIATQTVDPKGAPLYSPDRNNFGPRLGFSWDPFGLGKTAVRGGFGVFYNPQLTGAVFSLTDNTSNNISVNVFQELFGTVSCSPSFPLSYPIGPVVPTCTPQVNNVDEFDPHTRDSYAYHYSFDVQQQLAPNTVLDVAYDGDRGLKLPAGAAFAGLEFNNQNLVTGSYPLSTKYANERLLGDYLDSKYNSMQVALRGRNKLITYDVNFTWAQEFDDTVSVFGAFVNPTNPQNDFSHGDIDVRDNLTSDAYFHSPDIKYLPRVLGRGWDIGALASARSGLPVNITTNVADNYSTPQRPDFAPAATIGSIRARSYSAPDHQFNLAAFSTTESTADFGNVPRNAGRGPVYAQVDLSFMKTTPIGDKWKTQFRADLFNIANHPNFANPDGITTDPTFGESLSTVGTLIGQGTSRQVQFSIKIIR